MSGLNVSATLLALALLGCGPKPAGLPAIGGSPASCDPSQELRRDVCTWAQLGDAVVYGTVASVSSSTAPLVGECEVLERALKIELRVDQVLWGTAQPQIGLAFGPTCIPNGFHGPRPPKQA